jgi:RNA polymerase sigma-70 factor (ECF subfamily)
MSGGPDALPPGEASMSRDPDALLLARCLDGDEAAWRDLYRGHARRVARFLAAVIGPDQDVDDLVQQVFVEVLASARSYRGASRFSTWMLGIASHVASRYVRDERRRRLRLDAVRDDAGEGGQSDPLRLSEEREALEAVSRAVGRLDVAHRVVWVMREVEGLPGDEVAGALSIPIGTVRSRLFHARQAVAKALEARGFAAPRARCEVVTLPVGPGRAAR